MFITIETIPHASQRYPTVGDWQFGQSLTIGGSLSLRIRVSQLNNPDYELAIGIHELIEAYLAHRRGIKEADVDRFDMDFERTRAIMQRTPRQIPRLVNPTSTGFTYLTAHGLDAEPGDDPSCPIYREHQFATIIERQIIREFGLDWNVYQAAIDRVQP